MFVIGFLEFLASLPLILIQYILGIITRRPVGSLAKGAIVSTWSGGAGVRLEGGEYCEIAIKGLLKTNPGFDSVWLVWTGWGVGFGWHLHTRELSTPERVKTLIGTAERQAKNDQLCEIFGMTFGQYSQGADGPGHYSEEGEITLSDWYSKACALGSEVNYDISWATSEYRAETEEFIITGSAVTGGWEAARPEITVSRKVSKGVVNS